MTDDLMQQLSLIEQAQAHGDAVAFQWGAERKSYADLLEGSRTVARDLLESRTDLNEDRIAFLLPAGFDYARVQWGIWRAGGIAVPLSLSATEKELEYTLTDSGANGVVTSRDLADRVLGLCDRNNLPWRVVEDLTKADGSLPEIEPSRRAMILYTSGTTSQPKGVVSTHAGIQAQIESLVEAWRWQADDRIPLFLPLHHIHGIINILSCALWSGAAIEPFPRFAMDRILQRVAENAYTVFMAVPTIYVKLIQAMESLPPAERAPIVAGFGNLRLMVSGSAALPASVHEQWTALTGQKLLERYGMTEIGMALSNPYEGERRPGAVGQPLPGVAIRLQSEQGETIAAENEPGEIQVRGPNVFRDYWNRPDATRDSFQDGWFCTGDIAVLERGYYRIMGRSSVDIIKSGGYKLSALEIEAVLLDHPAIRECAVVGLADDTWGELIAVALVLEPAQTLELEDLIRWCEERVSAYKIPRRILVVDQLPRNAMGKVTKPAVRKLF